MEYQTIKNGLERDLRTVSRLVSRWRTQKRRYGLNEEENYHYKKLKSRETKLRKQLKGLTNKS